MPDDNLAYLLVYALLSIVAVAVAMAVPRFIAPRRTKPLTDAIPFESGVLPTGSARLRISVQYYRVALFFVIFDLEAAFLYAYAIAWREAGIAGYVEVLIFIAILVAALGYLWRLGALDWAPQQFTAPPAATGTARSDAYGDRQSPSTKEYSCAGR